MFLTGFDAPPLNTLFVDKNLRYHGLIQAYSRTNRILNKVKSLGNIVCFRDLEQATKEAIKCFGSDNDINIILERSYNDYLFGYTDDNTKEEVKGFETLCKTMIEKFPEPTEIHLDKDKKEFAQIFGEILRLDNTLKNYDEFYKYEPVISERLMQDMKSVYVDIKDEVRKAARDNNSLSDVDFSDIEFQVEFLKSDEINLDYIIGLILEKSQVLSNSDLVKEEIRRIIRSSIGNRPKEELIISFIDNCDFNNINKKDEILQSFYEYAKARKKVAINNLINEENLKNNPDRFIEKSISSGQASPNGTELDSIVPPTSRRAGAREQKKNIILEKISNIVDIFNGV